MRLQTKITYGQVQIVDHDHRVREVYYDNFDRVRSKNVPKKIASVSVMQSGSCCALSEVGHFTFSDLTPDVKKECYGKIASGLNSYMRKKKKSMVFTAFRRGAAKTEFEHQGFMDILIKKGWKKIGGEFMNLGYPTNPSDHNIQVLGFLVQPKKRGNSL